MLFTAAAAAGFLVQAGLRVFLFPNVVYWSAMAFSAMFFFWFSQVTNIICSLVS